MPSVPNPYFIYIELFWPDGHRATQNEIATVNATDINAGVNTVEGQSGWDPTTGGWQPIFMQNIAVFIPRGAPNLRFDVINTQNVDVYQTVVFNNIASGSTVHIIIGQSATIVGGGTGPTTFTVTGHARKLSNSAAFFPGNIKVFDVTNNSELCSGARCWARTAHTASPSRPTVQQQRGLARQAEPSGAAVRPDDGAAADPIGRSSWAGCPVKSSTSWWTIRSAWARSTRCSARHERARASGSGVMVQAFDMVWTTAGIQEISLGTTVSDGRGTTRSSTSPRIRRDAQQLRAGAGPDQPAGLRESHGGSPPTAVVPPAPHPRLRCWGRPATPWRRPA